MPIRTDSINAEEITRWHNLVISNRLHKIRVRQRVARVRITNGTSSDKLVFRWIQPGGTAHCRVQLWQAQKSLWGAYHFAVFSICSCRHWQKVERIWQVHGPHIRFAIIVHHQRHALFLWCFTLTT